MGQIIDLTNQTFGDWTAIRYIGDSMWECMNSEGEVKNIHSYTLRTKLSNHTKLGSKQPEGVLGNTFGQWAPIKYLGAGFWECKCTCGNTGKVNTYDLKNGFSTRCKQCKDKAHMKTVYNPGDRLGEWTIMYYAGDMRWHCKCSCGKEKDVLTKYLRDGTSKSCGHDRNYHIIKDDITGKRFGSLVVPGYTGSSNMWQCKCDCGTIKNIHRDSLMTGKTKSCGCLKETMRAQTLFARYGDTNTNRVNNPREEWQIEALHNKDMLLNVFNLLGHKPTIMELKRILDVREGVVKEAIKNFELEDYIQVGDYVGESSTEIEIAQFLSDNGIEFERHNREVLSGRELDIYIPSKSIAIEINGDYWHSSLFKDKEYHRNKTFDCIKRNIQLIHIFEHEWNSAKTNSIVKNILLCALTNGEYKSSSLCRISIGEAINFLRDHSINIDNNIKVCIGYKDNDRLTGVVTFEDEQEDSAVISNIAWEHSLDMAKMLADICGKIQSKDIKTTCVLYNGPIIKLCTAGFKPDLLSIGESRSQWVDIRNSTKVESRERSDSEMADLGYIKLYDSGTLDFIFGSHV